MIRQLLFFISNNVAFHELTLLAVPYGLDVLFGHLNFERIQKNLKHFTKELYSF